MSYKLHGISTAVLFIFLFIGSCSDDPASNNDNEYFVVNNWIRNNMEFYYFWNELVPEETDGSVTPEVFFESMLDSTDRFSNISDDAQAYLDDVQGSSFSAGYSPQFMLQEQYSKDLLIFVRFVYPDSPAEEAGLKRGDLILKINGQALTTDNYLDLYYDESAANTLTLGYLDRTTGDFVESRTISVTKVQREWNPIVHTEVYDYDEKKIGFIFYSRFVNGIDDKFVHALNDTLASLKARGITDLIIDLRYNPGGTISTAQSFANSLAPASVTQNEEIFVEFQYNDNLQKYYEDAENENPSSGTSNLEVRFSEAQVNLGLDRVFFITTGSSASASELLINGLEPYMEVVSIGRPTYGKFYGAYVLTGLNADPSHNYAISPVTMKYANALGVTDFANGLNPDYEMERENVLDVKGLGSSTDPFIAKALELISGETAPPAKVSAYTLNMEVDNHVELKKGNVMFIPQR